MSIETEIPLKLENFLEASGRIAGVARRTDLLTVDSISRATGTNVYLKLENLQRTGSFKLRGAFNKISRLAELPGSQRPPGIIAVSAGNHAQGVAAASLYSGFQATVVMPATASLTKVRACKELKAEVVLYGASLEEAAKYAYKIAEERNLHFCHPYDDWDIICGQGTMGLEILQDVPDVTTVVAPLGGGGMLSGVALAIKLQKPEVRIIGVQTEAVAPYYGYIQSGRYRPDIPGATTIADGIRVKAPGDRPSKVIRHYVDDVVTVDDGKIAETIVALLERTRTLVEGAGAVGLAALLTGKIALRPGEKVVTILSGGNIDTPLVGHIIDYGLSSIGRLVNVLVIIPDQPGQLYKLLGLVAESGMNIRQVEHRRGELHVPVGQTEVVLQIECRDHEHHRELVERLWAESFQARVLS
jgi:threonine dehydratase